MFEGLFKRNAGLGNTEVIKENTEDEKSSGLLVHNQRVAIEKISRSIEDTGSATETLINIIGSISKNVELQVESINKVIDKIESYSALAEEVYSRTSDSRRIAGETLQTAEQGNTAVDNIIKSMNGIETSVDYIKEVISSLSQKAGQVDEMLVIIKDIASQTNLLSLNASIEAARAGEHGRGFAVVADEVRKLAQKSNESVNKISNTIKGINDSIEKAMEAAGISSGKVREGVATAADTIDAFKKIINSINTTVSVTGEISTAVSEQTGHLEDVISSAGEMKRLSEKVMSMIEVVLINTQQTKSSIEMLNLTSKELVEITSKILKESSYDNSGIVLRTCVRQKLESMDPAVTFNQETSRVFSNVHRGLLAPGLYADIIPGISKSWYVEDDNLTWVFNLRKGVKFHNGREVTAEDVKYSLERVLSPSLDSPNAWFLLPIDGAHEFQNGRSREVKGIKALDRYRVSIRLSSPYAGFLLNLSQTCCSILAREDIEKGKFTGCGPYILEEMGDNRYRLTGFKDYFGGSPYVDRVEVSYGDEDMARGLIEGRYNFVIFANNAGLDEIKKSHLASNLKSQDVMTTTFAGFNLKSNSIFAKNKELRKAINYAVNKKRIIEDIMKGLAKEAKGVFPPSIIDNGYLAGFSYNPEKAKGILKKEGFYDFHKKLVILGWQNNTGVKTTNERIVEYIAEDLKALGIECDVVKVPAADYLKAENVSKCDLFIMGWVADTGDPDNYLEPLFNPDNYTDFTGYNNKEILNLMAQAKEILNPEKRVNMYRKIQDMIIEDAPWVFLHHPVTVYAYDDGVGNIRLNPMGKVRFEDIVISKK